LIQPSSDINQLLKEAYAVRINNLSGSIELANEALLLSEKAGDEELKAQSLNSLALFYMILGQYEKSINLSKQALEYFETSTNIKGIADANYNIASVYYKSNNSHLGLQYFLKCLSIYRQLEDFHNEARVLKAMGTIYEYFGDTENAVDSYKKSIAASRKVNDPNLESNAYNPLSGIYLNQGRIDEAKELIDLSVELKKAHGDYRGLGFALYGRGKVNFVIGEYELAEQDYLKSIEIHLEMGDNLGQGMTYLKLGLLYIHLQKYPEARTSLLQASKVAHDLDISLIKFKSAKALYELNKKESRTAEALAYLEDYIATKEKMINSESYNLINSYKSIAKIESLESEAHLQREKSAIIEEKNVELDSFFHRISHDIKGPISSLLGLHEIMKMENELDLNSFLEMSESQIVRLNTIVMELISLTQMNHVEANKKLIDFDKLINDCISSYKYLPNFNKIDFNINVTPNIEFYSEWSIINTIMQNLIENCVKYADQSKNANVGIFIDCQNETLQIAVEDNGLGISEAHQKKVFDMFYRASFESDGTGLGLFILKRAVDRLKGKVDLESALGVGTKFMIELPI
jgi:signal transduction histidine kinase